MKRMYESLKMTILDVSPYEGILAASGDLLTAIDPVEVTVTPMEEERVTSDFGTINFY